MGDLERFLHDDTSALPVLVKAALAHVQFETIHPFLDGNGRLGRLLIALLLHHGGLLADPLLYLEPVPRRRSVNAGAGFQMHARRPKAR
jgi:Fic family protein